MEILNKEISKEVIEIIVELHATFSDYEKIHFWLTTKNLNFGDVSPLYLILIGRGHKVLQFIKSAAEEQ